ncbi:MAG: hypothetical protein WBV96_06595, partial [Polyangia bacterium]
AGSTAAAAVADSGKAGAKKKAHKPSGRKAGKVVGSKSGGAEPSEATKKSDASVDALLRGLK